MNAFQLTLRVLAATCLFCGLAMAQAPDQSRPLLEQLNREVQSLYREVQGGIVQVQLPAPRWAVEEADQASPLNDPKVKLNDDMRRLLEQQRSAAKRGDFRPMNVVVGTTTQPATRPMESVDLPGWKGAVSPDGRERVLEPKGGTAIVIDSGGGRLPGGGIKPPGQTVIGFAPANDFAPNNVGLLLDEEGHFLVPVYVEKETIGKDGVKVAVGGEETTARFVGSDRQTGLTVLKLARPIGQPVRLSVNPPQAGALVLLLSPNRERAKLIVWMSNVQDAGIVAGIDGGIAGFARYGQFFSARAARPVIEQLKQTGTVRRASLGMTVEEVRREDPARRHNLILSDRPALRVQAVARGSLADKAQLQSGDLIFAVGSEPVGDIPTFAAFLSAHEDRTALQVARGAQTQIITLDLRPSRASTTRATRPAR